MVKGRTPTLSRRVVIRALAGSLIPSPQWTASLSRLRDPYYPGRVKWETLSPVEAGIDPQALESVVRYAATHNSTGFLILRGGRIVTEQYWQQWTPEVSQPIFSAGKSLIAILVGMAIEEGLLKGVEQRVSTFVPSWRGTSKEAITIRHLLTMTSGLQLGGALTLPYLDVFARTTALPLEHRPGEHWAYNSSASQMLLRLLEMASGERLNRYTQRKLAPLQLHHSSWDCGLAPNDQLNCTWFRSSLRDMAKFGLLMLRQGRWADRQLIGAAFVKEATSTSQMLNKAYGYLWWLNGKSSFLLPDGRGGHGMLWPDCPPDAFAALGAEDKKIYVVPSLDLVVARHGGPSGVELSPGDALGPRSSFDNQLLRRISHAVKR